jgi:membrane dipeptidase
VLIFDGDYPMAALAIQLRRDVTQPLDELRRRDRDHENIALASLPEMRKAGMAVAILKVVSDMQREGSTITGYNAPHRLYAVGKGQIAYYAMLERMGELRIIRTRDDLREHMAQWEAAQDDEAARAKLPVGAILGLEGADSVTEPDQLEEWWADGIRLVSIGHYGMSPYGGGTGVGTDVGLLDRGPDLLREMDRLGMLLDVTHTSDRSVREALAVFNGPLLATHSNVRALCKGERQLPDDLVQAVIDRDGVVGASMDTWMLWPEGAPDWGTDNWPNNRKYFPRDAVTLNDLVDHMEYVNRMAGDALHSGIGGDTDGQGGRECAPADVDTIVDYHRIADILRARGRTEQDVENVMWRNWVRLFDRALPGA